MVEGLRAMVSRRALLAGCAATGLSGLALPVPARAGSGLRWVSGDHHVHTKYSGGADAPYRVDQQVAHALEYGLGWLVVTDHPGRVHQRHGLAQSLADIRRLRTEHPELLLFQGIEWNVPAGDHATVFTAPGPYEATLLADFEARFDARMNDTTGPGRAGEAEAVRALRWLADQVRAGRTAMALCIVNHPGRAGAYGPGELRALRDAHPMVIGMEGAPGGQAAGVPADEGGPGGARGAYDQGPSAKSYPGCPAEAFRTFGGFDWMTATVGGVWDAMLAEGLPWWITASSDAHKVLGERWRTGGPPTAAGFYPDPLPDDSPGASGSFWPGQYSRTHLGLRGRTPLSAMQALRDGRIWVDHGQLIDGLEVSVGEQRATLGELAVARRGDDVELRVRIALADRDNHHGQRPRLRRVDVIAGPVTGPVADRDTRQAPRTEVVASFEVDRASGEVVLRHRFERVEQPFYLRLRGTDGNVSAPGSIEPREDRPGDADPWEDLWFYTNPVFVDVSAGR